MVIPIKTEHYYSLKNNINSNSYCISLVRYKYQRAVQELQSNILTIKPDKYVYKIHFLHNYLYKTTYLSELIFMSYLTRANNTTNTVDGSIVLAPVCCVLQWPGCAFSPLIIFFHAVKILSVGSVSADTWLIYSAQRTNEAPMLSVQRR